jgi:hypothetical protein
MVQTGGYFVFALDSDRSATAFRSDLGHDTLAGLQVNMARIQASTTSDAQYRSAVTQFAANPHRAGPVRAGTRTATSIVPKIALRSGRHEHQSRALWASR